MITTPTTFITGAGASASFKLPLGARLLQLARELQPHDQVYKVALATLGGRPYVDDLDACLQDLRSHSARLSLDSFLETRHDFEARIRVGKVLIASLMGRALYEHKDHLLTGEGGDDWLGYLFERMREGARTAADFIDGNKVNFVTFNFDTVIEQRLKSFIQRTFCGPNVSFDGLSSLVVHVHGALPQIPDQAAFGAPDNDQSWMNWTQQGASSVNVVSDQIPDRILEAARASIASAKIVCFLGFSYQAENLRKLGIPGPLLNNKIVLGSACGLEAGEVFVARARIGVPDSHLKLGEKDHKALMCLRTLPIFRE